MRPRSGAARGRRAGDGKCGQVETPRRGRDRGTQAGCRCLSASGAACAASDWAGVLGLRVGDVGYAPVGACTRGAGEGALGTLVRDCAPACCAAPLNPRPPPEPPATWSNFVCAVRGWRRFNGGTPAFLSRGHSARQEWAGRALGRPAYRGARLHHPARTAAGSRGYSSSLAAPRWSRSWRRTPGTLPGSAGPRGGSFHVWGPRGCLCSEAEDTRLEVWEWGDVPGVYVMCVPVLSVPWDKRREERNCPKDAELPRVWGLKGAPLGTPGPGVPPSLL